MSQDMVIVSIIIVFIVLVVILINKDKSETSSDDSKDASTNSKHIASRDSVVIKNIETGEKTNINW